MTHLSSRYLITSALPYINGVKHLGNLVGSILPADVAARYLRQQNRETLFICGTDEHGTPAEIAAQEAGQDIETYCIKMYQVQKDIYERFSIEFDAFGRSSAPSNHTLTQKIFLQLEARGFTEEREIKQYFSHEDNRFLPDRYVIGTCPHCGFDKARGDQCDGCGNLLDPTDLKDPRSALSGSSHIELRTTKHIFLRLDLMTEMLSQWQAHQTWGDIGDGLIKKWMTEGLKPRCITRDLKWGVQVPKPGYEGKVFYVWFDAPNGYVSMTQDWAEAHEAPEDWKKWWEKDQTEDVTYIQFMGKDNVPFHTVFWPAIVLSSNIGWGHQAQKLKAMHWLTYDKGKFSTSQKRGVFTDQAIELYPADYWRYYLMANCPENADSDFTFAHFAATINKDLADILGNFANRTLSIIAKHFENSVPDALQVFDATLMEKAHALCGEYHSHMEAMAYRKALQTLRALWVLGNEYITEQKPWEVIKVDRKKAAIIMAHCLHLLRIYGLLSYPIIPTTSLKILEMLKDPLSETLAQMPYDTIKNLQPLPMGAPLDKAEILFVKIDDQAVEDLTQQYSGA